MTRDLVNSLAWADQGTGLCRSLLDKLDDAAYDAPSLLPGWTRRHLVAHLALNANGLCNLVSWARTGIPMPMYASTSERKTGIYHGARLPPEKLARWFEESADILAMELDSLDARAWAANVQTAQGRTVPASELP